MQEIIPLPHAGISGSGSLFPLTDDQVKAREPLVLLDTDIARTRGKSVLAKHTLNVVKGYLDETHVTE